MAQWKREETGFCFVFNGRFLFTFALAELEVSSDKPSGDVL